MTHTIKANQIENMPATNFRVATKEDIEKITNNEENQNGN